MEKRYTAVRIIATIFRIFGVLTAILVIAGVVVCIVGLVSRAPQLTPLAMLGPAWVIGILLGALLLGFIITLSLFAISELYYLLINLEENTRYTGILLRDRQPQ